MAGTLCAGCGGGLPSAEQRLDDMASKLTGGSMCSAERATKPYVMRWEAAERGTLESRLPRGLVLVKFSGCSLEVIKNCTASAELSYEYLGLTPKEEEQRIKTVDDLYANIPMGAGALEAELRSKGELRVASLMVGRYEAPVSKLSQGQLEGDRCDEVTHAVQAVSVGAFQLFAGAGTAMGGSVGVLGAGVGSRHSEEQSSLSRDGDFEACSASSVSSEAPPDGCGALLRLELLPVKGSGGSGVVKQGRVCPAGQRYVEGEGCVQGPSESDSDRFVAEGDKVLDTVTALEWQRHPAAEQMRWEDAKRYCRELQLADVGSWRLPRKKELLSLVDKSQASAKIDPAAFPDTPASAFWSSAPDRDSPGDAWIVDFHSGQSESIGTGSRRHVRCLRPH